MSKFKTTILQVSIHREDSNPIFGEGNTYVKVEDEAGGPFIVLEQSDDFSTNGTIRLEYDELPVIMEAAKMLMHQMYIEKINLENTVERTDGYTV